MGFANRVAIVTGAAPSIGEAVANRLVAEGAALVIADVYRGGAKVTARKLGAAGRMAMAWAVDVGISAHVAPMAESVLKRFGRRTESRRKDSSQRQPTATNISPGGREDPEVGVGVHVDESGGNDRARRVDRSNGLLTNPMADQDDFAVLDSDLGLEPRAARPVNNPPVSDQDIPPSDAVFVYVQLGSRCHMAM